MWPWIIKNFKITFSCLKTWHKKKKTNCQHHGDASTLHESWDNTVWCELWRILLWGCSNHVCPIDSHPVIRLTPRHQDQNSWLNRDIKNSDSPGPLSPRSLQWSSGCKEARLWFFFSFGKIPAVQINQSCVFFYYCCYSVAAVCLWELTPHIMHSKATLLGSLSSVAS